MAGRIRKRERLWTLERRAVVIHAELRQFASGRCELKLLTGSRLYARSQHATRSVALSWSSQIWRDLRADGWQETESPEPAGTLPGDRCVPAAR
jgi:hypothetical protein